MIVCSGRLRGASTFGWARSSVNSAPRFCSGNPVPSATTPDPKLAKLLWMSDTMLPSRSTTERYVVSPPSLATAARQLRRASGRRAPVPLRDRSARRARARIPCSTSPSPALLKTPDRRRAAACRRTRASSPRSGCAAHPPSCARAAPKPSDASMMFNIISAAMPAPFGGSSKTSQPR